MRAKFISGVAAALLLVPVGASADQHEPDDLCYREPLADECVTDVLPEEPVEQPTVEPPQEPAEPTEEREVQPTEVLAEAETPTLARTGIETPGYLALAIGLLAAGGLLLFGSRRRRDGSSAS